MNIKLALGALMAALVLTACAKQEAVSTDTAPAATEEAAPADTASETATSEEGAMAEGAATDGAGEATTETPAEGESATPAQ
ncbi:MAG TPA: hypothetical protein VIL32_15430 [Steroidobacteraceae bacterium]